MNTKIVTANRRARHDYEILDTFEAGMVLDGSEVKSLRAGQASIKEAYAEVRAGELWLESSHIAPYQFAREGGHDPVRPRKLLMHRREINRIQSQMAEKGLTLVPLSIYFKDGNAKVELALARGRRRYDKRQAIKKREMQREIDRAQGRARKG